MSSLCADRGAANRANNRRIPAYYEAHNTVRSVNRDVRRDVAQVRRDGHCLRPKRQGPDVF